MAEYWKNGIKYTIPDMTPSELAEMQKAQEEQEKAYWTNISYEDAVNAEIRKKYSESAEFAILRQKDEKPNEYAEYYRYCEECKAYVKAQKAKFGKVE